MFWLALGYPLLAHLAVIFDDRHLQWFALVWLLGVALAGALKSMRIWAWGTLASSAAILYYVVISGDGLAALYVPPAVIPAALGLLFATSLRTGETPLVTRFARQMHDGPLPDDLVAYTRRVTQLWCFVCAALFVSAVVFALWASPAVWSLMTNVIHYFVLGAVFVAEFLYRRIRFSHYEHSGLLQYLQRLAHTRLRP